MEWFALGAAVVSAIAAIWSAVSSHRSADEAKDTRRPYVAVTGNQVTSWDGKEGTARFFITNAGPVPGRVTTQSNKTTVSTGHVVDHGTGSTESDVIYPAEKEAVGFSLPIAAGDVVHISLEYEDLARKRQFEFEIDYAVDPGGELQIMRREAT